MRAESSALRRTRAMRFGASVAEHPHVILAALMLLTSVLGFLRLDVARVNFDEEVSISHAHESWGTIWHTVSRNDPNMGLYYVALKLWTGVFGDSVFAVRSLSVVAAVLCVPVVYAIGVRLFGVGAGLVAALLLSTNVFFLRYAQEARSYALLTLLVSLSMYCFLVALERTSLAACAGYVGASVLAFYAHYFALWVIPIQAATLLAVKGRSALTRTWLITYGVLALLIAPMALRLLTVGTSWIDWLERPGLNVIPATYAQLAGNSFLHLGVIAVVCLLAIRGARESPRLAFGLAFTAAWALVPVLAAFTLSQLKPMFLARYLIISLPAMLLLAAGAICTLRPAVAAAAVCLLVALSVPKLDDAYQHGFPFFSLSQQPVYEAARGTRDVRPHLGGDGATRRVSAAERERLYR